MGAGSWRGDMGLVVGGRCSDRWQTLGKGIVGRTCGWEFHSADLGMVMNVTIDTSLGTVDVGIWRVLGMAV